MSLSVENKFIILDKTSTIKVEGDDRVQFLQGQLTQDINLVSQNNALYAGFCNPKGRMLAFMLCYLNHESIHLQIDSSIQNFILQKLRMYILRSKVSLKLANETFTCVGFVGSNLCHYILATLDPKQLIIVDNLLSSDISNVPVHPQVHLMEHPSSL